MTEQRLATLLWGIRRRCNREDARPLHAYRVHEDELAELRSELQAILNFRLTLEFLEPAAFCLFAAEWFRRNHRDGPWKWATILVEGLGLSPEQAREFSSSQVTRKGLTWWRRPVIETASSQRFLTTLVCEGGLPLQVLRNENSALRRYFRAVLREYEKFGGDASALAEHYNSLLPETLRLVDVYELIGRIITCIAELRRLIEDFDGDSDLERRLAERRPNWEDALPLRLDDELTKDLIEGLLFREPRRQASRSQIKVTTILKRDRNHFYVSRDLHVSSMFDIEQLAALFKTVALKLPQQFDLYLVGQCTRVRVVTVRQIAGSSEYRALPWPHSPVSANEAVGRVRVSAVVGTRELASADVPGGETLPESPWVFDGEEPHTLLGIGSLSTRRPTVVVVVSPETTCAAPGCVDAGTLDDPHRHVLQIRGDAALVDPSMEPVAHIKTAAGVEESRTFELHGNLRSLGPGGSEVWFGLPEFIERKHIDGSDFPTKVEIKDIRWTTSNGSRRWRPIDKSCLGAVLFRVQRAGEVLFETRALVLPPTTRFQLKPGPGTSAGSVRFDNVGVATVNVAKDRRWQREPEVRCETHNVEIHVVVQNDPPATISLRIALEGGGFAHLLTACPVPHVSVVDAAQRPWPPKLSIPVDSFDGLRLRVVNAQGGNFRSGRKGEVVIYVNSRKRQVRSLPTNCLFLWFKRRCWGCLPVLTIRMAQ